jgi:hypothetical protein
MMKMNTNRILSSILASLLLIVSQNIFAQKGKLPPFKMIKADGSIFRAQDLPMGKPIVIIYFSPDCEECQKVTQELVGKIESYWKASVVMVTYLPVNTLAPYISKNKLYIYPNIFVGTEGDSFFLRYYYNVVRFPFIALYSKDGDLIKAYYNEVNLVDVTKMLKDL